MRISIVTTALALFTLAATPALAAPRDGGPDRAARADGPKFPMPAAAFQQKVDARMAKARAKMEARAAKLAPAEAKELRAKFDAGKAKVDAAVAKATADGTVTKDEAKAVREAVREARGKHARGEHARGKRGHGERGDAGKK